MESRAGHYDLHLLQACFECLQQILASTINGETPAAAPGVERLTLGQILVADVLL